MTGPSESVRIVSHLEFYLAHPLNSRKKIREWELDFEARTKIDLINPFYDVYRPDIEDKDAGIENPRTLEFTELVENDINLLRKARNGMIAIVDENTTVGTLQERVYAHSDRKLGKSVYSVITNGMQKHPWLKYHSTKIFSSLIEFEQYITAETGNASNDIKSLQKYL